LLDNQNQRRASHKSVQVINGEQNLSKKSWLLYTISNNCQSLFFVVEKNSGKMYS